MSGLFAPGIQREGVALLINPRLLVAGHSSPSQRAAYISHQLIPYGEYSGGFFFPSKPKAKKSKRTKRKEKQETRRARGGGGGPFAQPPLVNGKTFNCRIFLVASTNSELPDRDMAVSFVCLTPDKVSVMRGILKTTTLNKGNICLFAGRPKKAMRLALARNNKRLVDKTFAHLPCSNSCDATVTL